MRIVKNLLNQKGNTVWSAAPNTPVYEALQLMADKDIGALVVLDNGRLAGIFSERDYARKVILKGKSSRNTPIKEIMTSSVVTAHLKQTVNECLALMARHRIRHLPVLEEGRLVGIISIGDVVQAIIADQEEALQQLERAVGPAEEIYE